MEKYILKQFVAVFTFTKGASSPHKTLSVQMKGLSFLFQDLNFFQPHSSADSGASKSKLVIFWLFFYFKRSRGRRGEEIVGDQGWGSLSDVNVFSVLSLWVAGFLCWSDNTLPLFGFFLTVCHSNTVILCQHCSALDWTKVRRCPCYLVRVHNSFCCAVFSTIATGWNT